MKTKEEVCEKNPELVITDSKSSLLLYSYRSQKNPQVLEERFTKSASLIGIKISTLRHLHHITIINNTTNVKREHLSSERHLTRPSPTRHCAVSKLENLIYFIFFCSYVQIVVLLLLLSWLTSHGWFAECAMFTESGANNGFREDLKSKKKIIKHFKMSNPPFKYLNTPELWLTSLL